MNEVKAIISLGSNLGNREANLKQAIEKLMFLKDIRLEKCSSVYETVSWGYSSENLFYNAVVSVLCTCSAQQLLKEIIKIEHDMGRLRKSKSYSDRIIDMDIVDFNREKIDEEFLTLPHPRYSSRLFVLKPLQEIESEWIDLFDGVGIEELLSRCSDTDVPVKVSDLLCRI